ncbi:MAG: MipA/OmpV family protein [Sphingomonadaceae bacterium]
MFGAARLLPFFALLAFFLPAPAAAQEEKGWILTLGGGVQTEADFPGADRQDYYPWPLVGLRRAGAPEQFEAADDAIGIALVGGNQGLRAGPLLQFHGGRGEDDIPGLPQVDFTVELGAFGEYLAGDDLRLRAELRHGVNGHEGLVADLTADAIFGFETPLMLALGPRLRLAGASYNSAFFDVGPAAALASGLAPYDAGGGLHSAGGAANLRYRLGGGWALHAFAKYDRLLGDAGDSPIARQAGSRDQYAGGVGLAYSFRID